jgi:uncharacterized damage-inducible protein DinB
MQNENETLPQTIAEVRELMRQARAELERAIAGLSEQQLTTRRDAVGWSIKDHLMHLALWARGISALLQRQPRWEAMGLDGESVHSNDADQLNALLHQPHKDRPLAEVLAAFDDAHRGVLAALEGLSDADLARTYSYYQPDEPGEDDGTPIVAWIAGNTYEHYDEHRSWLAALI